MRMMSRVWKGVLINLGPVSFPSKQLQGYVRYGADPQVGGEDAAL